MAKVLRARADRSTVRFYDAGALVKTHPRKAPGGKSIDPNDYPAEKTAYAFRDIEFLARQAERHGTAIGELARILLSGPLPWTKMRQVYALVGLVKRFGPGRVEEACRAALAAEMTSVHRLRRMIENGVLAEPGTPPARVLPLARYLRPASQFAFAFETRGGV